MSDTEIPEDEVSGVFDSETAAGMNTQRLTTQSIEWDQVVELFTAVSDYLDPKNTRESFEQYLQDRADHYPEIAYYQTHGSWRDAGPHTDRHNEITEIATDIRANNCYHNVQTTLTPDMTYVEGYAITDGHIPVPHAWIEIEQDVVEITPPLCDMPAESVEYYGVAFDNSTVRESMIRREVADPIVEIAVEEVHAE